MLVKFWRLSEHVHEFMGMAVGKKWIRLFLGAFQTNGKNRLLKTFDL